MDTHLAKMYQFQSSLVLFSMLVQEMINDEASNMMMKIEITWQITLGIGGSLHPSSSFSNDQYSRSRQFLLEKKVEHPSILQWLSLLDHQKAVLLQELLPRRGESTKHHNMAARHAILRELCAVHCSAPPKPNDDACIHQQSR